jgi:hypothetical protein
VGRALQQKLGLPWHNTSSHSKRFFMSAFGVRCCCLMPKLSAEMDCEGGMGLIATRNLEILSALYVARRINMTC